MRRNSPSVMTPRPQSCCSRTTSPMASSCTARSSASGICRIECLRKASRSFLGRSRLPIWSARAGGVMLLALEARLSLLVEGAHAFLAIVGGDELVVGLDLEAVAGREVHLQAVVHRLLRLAHGERRVLGDVARDGERLLEDIVADAVHHSPFVSLLGSERLRGEDELLGAPLAGGASEVLRTAPARHEAEPRLRKGEARALCGID